MNSVGLQNKAGELLKEVEELLIGIKKIRHDKVEIKIRAEKINEDMTFMQDNLYVEYSKKVDDWNSPNPILDADGKTLPEFEQQWRQSYMSTMIQQDERFLNVAKAVEEVRSDYYRAQVAETAAMETLGIKKSEMGLITGLLRLADES